MGTIWPIICLQFQHFPTWISSYPREDSQENRELWHSKCLYQGSLQSVILLCCLDIPYEGLCIRFLSEVGSNNRCTCFSRWYLFTPMNSFNNMAANVATEGTINNVLLTEYQIGALGTQPRSDITEGKSPGIIFDLYYHCSQHFLIDLPGWSDLGRSDAIKKRLTPQFSYKLQSITFIG